MPYIRKDQREMIDKFIDDLSLNARNIPDFKSNKGGVLNYIITRLALKFMDEVSYKELSLLKSAMTDASDEWTRRKINPYEDEKIRENGDVKADIVR